MKKHTITDQYRSQRNIRSNKKKTSNNSLYITKHSGFLVNNKTCYQLEIKHPNKMGINIPNIFSFMCVCVFCPSVCILAAVSYIFLIMRTMRWTSQIRHLIWLYFGAPCCIYLWHKGAFRDITETSEHKILLFWKETWVKRKCWISTFSDFGYEK